MLGRGSGSIVNICSIMGHGANELNVIAYTAAKGALRNLTLQLGCEWADRGVRVNSVSPGFIVTEMVRPALEGMGMDKWIASRTPMRRIGELDEIVGPVLFLASDAASYITGHDLCVDGGTNASNGYFQIPPIHHEWNADDAPTGRYRLRRHSAPARLVPGACRRVSPASTTRRPTERQGRRPHERRVSEPAVPFAFDRRVLVRHGGAMSDLHQPLPESKAFGEDERSVLLGYLAYHRAVLARKLDGLSDEQAAFRPGAAEPADAARARAAHDRRRAMVVPPGVDRRRRPGAVRRRGGVDRARRRATIAEAMTAYWAEITTVNEHLLIADMDEINAGEKEHGEHALRRIIVHMIEEYARHCGHADLLREAIDGATGD